MDIIFELGLNQIQLWKWFRNKVDLEISELDPFHKGIKRERAAAPSFFGQRGGHVLCPATQVHKTSKYPSYPPACDLEKSEDT
jgi:hypothetical protein